MPNDYISNSRNFADNNFPENPNPSTGVKRGARHAVHHVPRPGVAHPPGALEGEVRAGPRAGKSEVASFFNGFEIDYVISSHSVTYFFPQIGKLLATSWPEVAKFDQI